jgi:oligoendopeptidase F
MVTFLYPGRIFVISFMFIRMLMGNLSAWRLYQKYKEDKNYIRQIEKFLSAGGSKSPEEIFKAIGIDTSKPSFFEQGLKNVEDDIRKLEKLLSA